MSHDNLQKRYAQTAGVALESTGDKATITPTNPIRVTKWGFLSADTDGSGIVDVGVGLVVSMDKRPTVYSDTNRVEIDTITTTADVALGAGLYSDLVSGFSGSSTAVDGSTLNNAPSSPATGVAVPVDVYPGQQLVFEVKDAADTDADNVIFWVEYIELPFVGDYISNYTKKNS